MTAGSVTYQPLLPSGAAGTTEAPVTNGLRSIVRVVKLTGELTEEARPAASMATMATS